MMKKSIAFMATLSAILLLGGCALPGLDSSITRGTLTDKAYENSFAGLKFALPGGWKFSTDEELAGMMNIQIDQLAESGKGYSKKMLELQNVFDMMAIDAATGQNVMVLFENLTVSGSVNISMDEYIKALQKGIEENPSVDADYTFSAISDAKVGQQDYKSFIASASLGDASVEQHYYLRKIGGYMLVMAVTVPKDTPAQPIIEQFQ